MRVYEFSFFSLLMFLICSCVEHHNDDVDRWNSLSYTYHYKNLDSAEVCARRALQQASNYPSGQAEALNNLAFVSIARMDYDKAQQQLEEIPKITNNQLELIVCYVQQMRLCQRRSHNREFYEYREQAQRAKRRIDEEKPQLSERQQHRLYYAETEQSIVSSTYFYYMGLEQQSIEELQSFRYDLEKDTAQYLNYLYNMGAGGSIVKGTQQEINQLEFDFLMRCLMFARRSGNVYFVANSLEALAQHLMREDYRTPLIVDNVPAMRQLNPHLVPDDQLPLCLADSALKLFCSYGDKYQIAGAYRTMASCCMSAQDYDNSLYYLEQAIADSVIRQAPAMVSSICEQLSIVYSAFDDKVESDRNRNVYLDLQEETRQDRQLEARANFLEHSLNQLDHLLGGVLVSLIVLIAIIAIYYFRRKRRKGNDSEDAVFSEREDELNEQLALVRLRIDEESRMLLEQRARVSLVNGLTPFIDRILHEVKHPTAGSAEYVRELTDEIILQNNVLTQWIQLRQGMLNLHIETFPLQSVFDLLQKNHHSFRMQGLTLDVQATDARVKADKVLTLFMLNTLADNARKFTPRGGKVTVYATTAGDYVEVSVQDTGIGMEPDQLAHVFERKVIVDDGSPSHGFGLLNCKGIINRYHKVSQIFSVCILDAESEKGRGSRFFFRLPRRVMMVAALVMAGLSAKSAPQMPQAIANAYSDSVYNANVEGNYEKAMMYADSCRYWLNRHFLSLHPEAKDTLLMLGDLSATAPEVQWYRRGVDVNYHMIVDMRNEAAVAALALHQWRVYHYNNRIYTQLFKEMSADNTLESYCRMIQQSQMSRQVAIILLLLLVMGILFAVAWQFFQSVRQREQWHQQRQKQLDLIADEVKRLTYEENMLHVSNAVLDNTLSTLKHETMYYPSRIRQLVDAGDWDNLAEVVNYYRELYGLLGMQSTAETGKHHLQLVALEHDVQGDRRLIDYLFELLRKQSGQKTITPEWDASDDKYVVCRVPMPGLKLTEEEIASLFMPHGNRIPFLLCRQIVRDHGEVTNRRGCAIRAEIINQVTTIIITLPKIWKNSKLSS